MRNFNYCITLIAKAGDQDGFIYKSLVEMLHAVYNEQSVKISVFGVFSAGVNDGWDALRYTVH